MSPELEPLINELCFIAVSRNAINIRRHRARYRKNYYLNALRVVEAHNNDNSNLRRLRQQLEAVIISDVNSVHLAASLNSKISTIERYMKSLILKYPKPKKWQTMGLHKLRSLILLSEGQYAMAKHETMEFSISTRSRVKYLVSVLKCSIHHDNGAVDYIHFSENGNHLNLEDIHHHAEQYELNRAIETIVEE